MKKIAELHFYGKNLKLSGMWGRYLSPAEQQVDGAVTMVISPLDDAKHKLSEPTHCDDKRIYVARPFCCNRKFTAELINATYERTFWCPNCGYRHPFKHIRFVSCSVENIPLDLYVRLYVYKEYVKLSLSYDAMRFEHNNYSKEIDLIGNIREDFIFDVKKRTAVRKLYINQHLSSELDIGFLKDWRLLQKDTALYYLRDDIKSIEGKTINVVFALLREAINRQAKQIKYSKRNMGVIGGYPHYRPLDSLLKIASQVRFWDSVPINFWGGHKDAEVASHEFTSIDQWACAYELGTSSGDFYDLEVDKLMSQGLTYHQAVIQYFKFPNIKEVRKRLSFEYFAVLRRLSNLEASKLNEVLPFFDKYTAPSRIRIAENLKTLMPIYNSTNIKQLFCYAITHEGKDAIDTYNRLPLAIRQEIDKKPPQLKDFHNYVVARHYEVKNSDFTIDIPKDTIKRLNKTVSEYTFTTLTSNYQCINAGKELHNCAKTYADRCGKMKQLVLVTDKDGIDIALLEINRFDIDQAKLKYNRCVAIEPEINNLICEYARIAKLRINTTDINLELDMCQVATA